MSDIIIKLIRTYRKVVVPVWGSGVVIVNSSCKFHPSCSEYAIDSIAKYGAYRGSIKSLIRVLRCNPFSRGGIDTP